MERDGESLRLAARIGMAFADGYGLSTEFRDYEARLRGSSLQIEREAYYDRMVREHIEPSLAAARARAEAGN